MRLTDRSAHKKSRLSFSFAGRTLSFTPFGTRAVVVCVLVGGAAVNTGHNLLYLCTAMVLSMIIVSGILSEQSLKKVSIRRTAPGELYAGTPFTVRYELTNAKKRIPSYALGVVSLYGDGARGAEAFALGVPAGGTAVASGEETAARRGVFRLEGFEISTRFPFGMFEKSRRMTASGETVVFPRLAELGRDVGRELAGGYGDTPVRRLGEGSELRSLRRYTSSDDARRIHWKSSARAGVLLARELEAEQDRTVTVVLDNSPAPAVRFEEAVSLAASAVRSLIFTNDLPVRLVTRDCAGEPGTGSAHYLALMHRLAVLSASPEAPAEPAALSLMDDGPSVLVLPGGRSAWSGLRGKAGLVLEAGDEA